MPVKHNILDAVLRQAHEALQELKNGNLTVQFVEEDDGEITEIRFYDNATSELVGIIGNKDKMN